jgi:hypothetical protein
VFAFRLALALGYTHPDVMLQHLTSRQFNEWQAFYQIDPFGEARGDLRTGILASVISNRMRGKHETALQPVDFMPFMHPQEQTPEDMQRTLRRILSQVK